MQALILNDLHYMVAGAIAKELLTLLAKWWSFEKSDFLILNKSLPYNVTGEMGLQLGDLADLARDYPDLIAYLRNASEDGFMEKLDAVDGEFKVKVVSRLITVYRSFMGLREHHKFVLVRHFALYKQAMLVEADHLVAQGVLQEQDDIFFLSLPEMVEVRTGSFEQDVQMLIASRKEEFEYYKRLTPPRVMTSEGEIIEGSLDGVDAPERALIGTPVSPGIVEGRAKVVLDPTTAALKEGEILVAPYTDPG